MWKNEKTRIGDVLRGIEDRDSIMCLGFDDEMYMDICQVRTLGIEDIFSLLQGKVLATYVGDEYTVLMTLKKKDRDCLNLLRKIAGTKSENCGELNDE